MANMIPIIDLYQAKIYYLTEEEMENIRKNLPKNENNENSTLDDWIKLLK